MTALEIAFAGPFGLFTEQDQKLLSNDGEHFDVDSVELIETAPGSSRSETLEEFTDHEVIHGIRTVEHNTLFGESFGQIFGGLCLACSCWSGWSSSQVEFECTHQSHVAFVCEGSDDQT